jgi:hypothetical protein
MKASGRKKRSGNTEPTDRLQVGTQRENTCYVFHAKSRMLDSENQGIETTRQTASNDPRVRTFATGSVRILLENQRRSLVKDKTFTCSQDTTGAQNGLIKICN